MCSRNFNIEAYMYKILMSEVVYKTQMEITIHIAFIVLGYSVEYNG